MAHQMILISSWPPTECWQTVIKVMAIKNVLLANILRALKSVFLNKRKESSYVPGFFFFGIQSELPADNPSQSALTGNKHAWNTVGHRQRFEE